MSMLTERYPDTPRLFTGNLRQRAVIRRMVQEADQYLATAMSPLLGQIFFTPAEPWDGAVIAAARQKLERELRLWEDTIGAAFLAGSEVSAADLSIYPHLALAPRLEKKKPDLNVRGAIGSRTGAWTARVEALPYFRKTWPAHWK